MKILRLVIEIVLLIIVILLIRYHSKKTVYICSKCKHSFRLSFFKDLFSISFSKKGVYTKCPHCNIKAFHMEEEDFIKKSPKNKKKIDNKS